MSESPLSTDNILPLIHTIRGQRVILAADLAKLYGDYAKRLNEQVKRNLDQVSIDFMFQLTRLEALAHSRSQFAILNAQGANIKHLPYAFTEHGAIMAANVLNSPQSRRHECLHRPSLRPATRSYRGQRCHFETPGGDRQDASSPRQGPARYLPKTASACFNRRPNRPSRKSAFAKPVPDTASSK